MCTRFCTHVVNVKHSSSKTFRTQKPNGMLRCVHFFFFTRTVCDIVRKKILAGKQVVKVLILVSDKKKKITIHLCSQSQETSQRICSRDTLYRNRITFDKYLL